MMLRRRRGAPGIVVVVVVSGLGVVAGKVLIGFDRGTSEGNEFLVGTRSRGVAL